jgi:hypothetical protein
MYMGLQFHAPEGTRHGTLPANSDRRAGWGGTSSHASKNFLFVRVKKNCSAFLERSDSSILATIATCIFGLCRKHGPPAVAENMAHRQRWERRGLARLWIALVGPPSTPGGTREFRLLRKSRHEHLQTQTRGSRLGSLYYDNMI